MARITYTPQTWLPDHSARVVFEPITAKPPTSLVTACMVFAFDKQDRLILARPKRGWGLPGGHREKGETPKTCAVREVDEETNIVIKNLRLIGRNKIKNNPNSTYNTWHYPSITYMLFYLAEIAHIKDYHPQFEVTERAFVTVENLPNYINPINHTSFYEIFEYVREMKNNLN